MQSLSAICGPGRTTRVKLLLMLFSKCLLHDNVFPSPQQTFYLSHTHEDMDWLPSFSNIFLESLVNIRGSSPPFSEAFQQRLRHHFLAPCFTERPLLEMTALLSPVCLGLKRLLCFFLCLIVLGVGWRVPQMPIVTWVLWNPWFLIFKFCWIFWWLMEALYLIRPSWVSEPFWIRQTLLFPFK